MFSLFNLILFIAATFILHRLVLLVSIVKERSWGSRRSFIMFSLSLGAIGGGCFAVSFGIWWGGSLLLTGLTGYFYFDRRRGIA